MGAVILGKMHLRWCDTCNIPILEQSACGTCGSKTREVMVTPPGDARPAFDHDIAKLRALIDSQYGGGTGVIAIPEGHIVLLNKAPDLDRMDEVIVNGEVVGTSRFDLRGGEKFLLRPSSADLIAQTVAKNWIKMDAKAVEAIRTKKASALAVGVLDCDPDIVAGNDVLVLDESCCAVSVGSSKMSSAEMMDHKRGTAVKTRWVVAGPQERSVKPRATWEQTIAANQEMMSRRVSKAKEFVNRVVRESGLPVAVSYSGGKDSLATLLLVLETGIKPSLLFVDTGLEFDETRKKCRGDRSTISPRADSGACGRLILEELRSFRASSEGFQMVLQDVQVGSSDTTDTEELPRRSTIVHWPACLRVSTKGREGKCLEESMDTEPARRLTDPEVDRTTCVDLLAIQEGQLQFALRERARENRLFHVPSDRSGGATTR